MPEKPKIAERFHPGEYVREEMAARGWSIETMCEETGMRRGRLEELLAEKRRLTLLDAYCIGKSFGTGMEVWRNLQKSFDGKEVEP